MRTLRRYLTVIALMFWLGGFTFYASVVVPIGMEVLKAGGLRQGFITQRVTNDLNLAAAVALAVLLAEVCLTADPSRRRLWARLGLWGIMAICQIALFVGHGYLDDQLQAKGMLILDPETFHPAHRLYLWTHTVQWGAGLLFIWLMLRAWMREDQASVPASR
jgi:hypothetical protein